MSDDYSDDEVITTRRGKVMTHAQRRKRGLTANGERRPLGLPRRVFRARLEEMQARFARNRAAAHHLSLQGVTNEEIAERVESIFSRPLPGDDLIANDDSPQSTLR